MTFALSLAALTCWLLRPLATPQWRFGAIDDVRQHLHRLGGQRRLTILAIVLSLAVLATVLMTSSGVNPDLRDVRFADASCGTRESPYDPPTCYALLPGGQWAVERMQPNGTREVIATVTKPDFVNTVQSAAPTTGQTASV
jgi:hypothetical protein